MLDQMRIMDTGQCAPESFATLVAQQCQLVAGQRPAQMFPLGTDELPLPTGMARYQNHRGIFHYRPDQVSAGEVAACSCDGRENEILLLGPYSKPEIAWRVCQGERPLCITERAPRGLELRTAVGTDQTVTEQMDYFERTKAAPENVVEVVDLLPMVNRRMAH